MYILIHLLDFFYPNTAVQLKLMPQSFILNEYERLSNLWAAKCETETDYGCFNAFDNVWSLSLSVIRIKEGRMDTSKILKSKLQRVTVGASAAKTVVEEYVDGHNRRTIKQKGNQRLMKDRAYLNRLSKLVIILLYLISIPLWYIFN